ncbi:MAG: PUR family DNA/RNA-binding protein [Prevotellaceae bacterium]|jgi:hypothetical protein|nr:PUR family DNA/RNA-binding protein [Prevotellaceae bacterium]
MMEDLIFSKSVKAGKRIYYLDVKKNRKDDLFLTITESKKIVVGEGDNVQISFEKHKIFLYQEDFEKFMNGLKEAMAVVGYDRGSSVEATGAEKVQRRRPEDIDEININIDFEEETL